MTAHAIAVGREEQGVPIVSPTGVGAEVSAIGEILNRLSSCGGYDTDVCVWSTLTSDEGEGDPLTIGRPNELFVQLLLAIGDLSGLLGLEIVDHQTSAIKEEGYFIPIGRELWVHLLTS